LGPNRPVLTLRQRCRTLWNSPTNAKALNTMRQRLKKHNVQFTEQIATFKEHPESTEEEESGGPFA
jgi:Eukaryotic translation initiation factor 3 subunit 8 N-terminus